MKVGGWFWVWSVDREVAGHWRTGMHQAQRLPIKFRSHQMQREHGSGASHEHDDSVEHSARCTAHGARRVRGSVRLKKPVERGQKHRQRCRTGVGDRQAVVAPVLWLRGLGGGIAELAGRAQLRCPTLRMCSLSTPTARHPACSEKEVGGGGEALGRSDYCNGKPTVANSPDQVLTPHPPIHSP